MLLEQDLEFKEDYEINLSNLLSDMKSWLSDSKSRHMGTKWYGVHDEGTYLTSWREYFIHTKDNSVLDYSFERFNAANLYFKKKLKLGYWKKQEAHHGVEHFVIFLPYLLELNNNEENVKNQLVRAANHITIKGKKRNNWFNIENNRFNSSFFGTKFVGKEGLNVVEHLRFIRLAWLGLSSGGDSTLKDFILKYSFDWADQIVHGKNIPIILDEEKYDNSGINSKLHKIYYSFVGAAPKSTSIEARSEIYIANGAPSLFYRLYQITHKNLYYNAFRRIVTPLVYQLENFYAHPLGELLFYLYENNKINEIDEMIQNFPLEDIVEKLKSSKIILNDNNNWKSSEYNHLMNNVGMRKDMPEIRIVLNGKNLNIPSPSTMGLFYRLTGDSMYLSIGLSIARSIFNMYRKIYPDGRKHGCGSKHVAASCIGHGRNWGLGYISAILRASLKLYPGEINLPNIIL